MTLCFNPNNFFIVFLFVSCLSASDQDSMEENEVSNDGTGSERKLDPPLTGVEMLPPGWSISEHNLRKVYLTPLPKRIKIDCKAKLVEYHSRGRFLEMKEENLVFGVKRKRKGNYDSALSSKAIESSESVNVISPMKMNQVAEEQVLEPFSEELNHETRNLRKLKREQLDLTEAIRKLTIDTTKPLDHKEILEDTARKLNQLRLKPTQQELCPNICELQSSLQGCRSEEDVAKLVWSFPSIQKRLASLSNSKLLEQVLSLGFKQDNPLSNFPPDMNKNLYKEIVDFALLHSEDLLLTLLTLTVKHEKPVEPKDVVQLAFLFATLAEFVSSDNSVMKKTKSISLKSCGLTNQGLDSLAAVGAAVTSRSYRNDRDMLAGVSEEVAKQYAKKGVPQFTYDNMDLQINHHMHHFTLNFMEFEILKTANLSTVSLTKSEMLKFFNLKTVLLTSDEELLNHYQFVTALTLGRMLAKEVPGMQWLLEVFPKHYNHPNRHTAGNKSLLHVSKPLYYQETVNDDMTKIMSSLQLEYLVLVGEQADQKDLYQINLRKILSVECAQEEREAAEVWIKQQVLLAGELICHGDQLTNERFESCKRLAQGSSSAFERFEFCPIFRLGTFHMRMSKCIQDLENGMPNEVNREDELSLGYFRTVLGLTHISNDKNRIKKEFEKHDQFCLEIGKEILVSAFKTFLRESTDYFPRNLEGGKKLILAFLAKSDIKYFYDMENYDEKDPYDDALSACRSHASRTVMSLVADTVVHESDGLGCRAVRTAMILYFLNKKIAQTNKYAASLLSNKIYYLGASEKTKARIDTLACCNPKGGDGNGLDRDIVNEHKVRSVKDVFKGLHSQLTDTVVEKSVLGDNIISMIRNQDTDSMLY